jgi:membrane-associated phospholipid phosphatase
MGPVATSDVRPHVERPVLTLSAIVVVVGLVALALTTVPVVRDAVVEIDAAWHRAVTDREAPGLVALAQAMAVLGGVYVTAPLRVLVSLVFAARRQWWRLTAWLLAIAASELVTTALKLVYDRQRPLLPLEATRSAAFPSGHAATAAVTATALVLLCTRPGPSRRQWSLVATVLVLLMGVSRVYLRVHWLSDVLMGTLVGLAAGLFAVGVTTVIAEHRRRATRPRH